MNRDDELDCDKDLAFDMMDGINNEEGEAMYLADRIARRGAASDE